MLSACVLLLCVSGGLAQLWPRGVVHYTINPKDYDPHSQDIITSAFERIEHEVCVKFFHSPLNSSAPGAGASRVLHVTNPEQLKACPLHAYDFNASLVVMPIGYKCVNPKDVARIVVDMLRASIEGNVSPMSSHDILNKFRERDHDGSTLLTPSDRNFINSHYFEECGELAARPLAAAARRAGDGDGEDDTGLLSHSADDYYKDKLWPLGVVMYGIAPDLRGSSAHTQLKFAMTTVELSSCVIFQYQEQEGVLAPRSMLWFARRGDDMPHSGFREGNQTISLSSMVSGAPGHTAHTLSNLLRALGVPMTSNRHDRDNYVRVNWKNVDKGKEYLLEKVPASAALVTSYDFESVTHAPANFACARCRLGQASLEPLRDPMWQISLSMGHRTSLSKSDVIVLNTMYGRECQRRFQ